MDLAQTFSQLPAHQCVYVSATMATWQFEVSHGVWSDMAQDLCAILSQAADTGGDVIKFTCPIWRWSYELGNWEEVWCESETDLQAMVQTNDTTFKTRRLRRVQVVEQHHK